MTENTETRGELSEQAKNEVVGLAFVVLAGVVSLVISQALQIAGLALGVKIGSVFLPVLTMILISAFCVGVILEVDS